MSRKPERSTTERTTLDRRPAGIDARIPAAEVGRPGSIATATGMTPAPVMFTPVTTLRKPTASRLWCTRSFLASSSSNEYGWLSASRISMSLAATRSRTNASARPLTYKVGASPGFVESADPTKISGRSFAMRDVMAPTTSAACACAAAWSSVHPLASATSSRSGWGISLGDKTTGATGVSSAAAGAPASDRAVTTVPTISRTRAAPIVAPPNRQVTSRGTTDPFCRSTRSWRPLTSSVEDPHGRLPD